MALKKHISLYPADLGNGTLKWIPPGNHEVQAMPSVAADIIPGERVTGDLGGSVYLQVLESDCEQLNGRNVVVGRKAYEYPNARATFKAPDKTPYYPILALATIDGEEGAEITIDCLVLQMLDTKDESGKALLREQIVGKHFKLSRNGKVFKLLIKNLVVVPEAFPGYIYTKQMDLLLPDSYNAYLDVGAGTIQGMVVKPNGEIYQGTSFVVERRGVGRIAEDIARNPAIIEALGNRHAKPEQILEAIKGGTYAIGSTFRRVDFKAQYDALRSGWMINAVDDALRYWDHCIELVETIYLFGGGANHMRQIAAVNEGWVILDQPEYVNIRGLALYGAFAGVGATPLRKVG
ncbi:ParM/StbA family protein [Leptolyngbya sp. FACHB-261]|uniref:ParM/StbA family protein n=1 Tax=Leptolyngbya sp. FACHB-261 TaxID=2692806 RepID=UPI0016827974|nr:hypothetical protein [Leptolyngbya sp. FACHB-261]MBD2100324.1 hypothetical protein [Leptolyngbya sp. FACHB-261]